MDTKLPLMLILCLGVAVAMFQASGAEAVLGNTGPSEDLKSGEQFNESARENNIDDDAKGYDGNVNPEADSDIVGVILGSFGQFLAILTLPGILGSEMAALGVPAFAAVPLGLLGNMIIYIGGFQVLTNRVYE